MEKEKWKQKVSEALLKVAQGCAVAEVVEEYVEVDGEMKLTKKKKTKKEIPPDLKALQLLLEEEGETGVRSMSDEELETEKQRLMELLKSKTEKEPKVEKKPKAVKAPETKKRRPMKRVKRKEGETK